MGVNKRKKKKMENEKKIKKKTRLEILKKRRLKNNREMIEELEADVKIKYTKGELKK